MSKMAATQKVHVISTKYFMYIYRRHSWIYQQNMKFLRSILSPGQLYTDATYTDAAKIMISYIDEIMNHDYIGSLACMPNEPKIRILECINVKSSGGKPFRQMSPVVNSTFHLAYKQLLKYL